MINVLFAVMALLIVPSTKTGDDFPTIYRNVATTDFLTANQVRTLVVSGRFLHRPPGARGNVSLSFMANGRVNFTNPRGRRGTGSWELKPSGVLCLINVGGTGTKTFCSLLTRKGNKVYHYHPKTHERLDANPWTIR